MRLALPALLILAPAGAAAHQSSPVPSPVPAPPSSEVGTPAAACPATPAPLPAEYGGWRAPAPVTAASTGGELGLATLPLGRSVRATLKPVAGVAFALAPGHQSAPATLAGLFAFPVTQAGTYRVALDAGVWIDVVGDGAAATSTAHGHGPACSGIRKLVSFQLAPGRYVLQVSGARDAALTLMVARQAG